MLTQNLFSCTVSSHILHYSSVFGGQLRASQQASRGLSVGVSVGVMVQLLCVMGPCWSGELSTVYPCLPLKLTRTQQSILVCTQIYEEHLKQAKTQSLFHSYFYSLSCFKLLRCFIFVFHFYVLDSTKCYLKHFYFFQLLLQYEDVLVTNEWIFFSRSAQVERRSCCTLSKIPQGTIFHWRTSPRPWASLQPPKLVRGQW